MFSIGVMHFFFLSSLLVLSILTLGRCHIEIPVPEPVVRGEVPYQASIQTTYLGLTGHSFSGVILDDRHIVTVGNMNYYEGELSILVGRVDFSNFLTGYRRSVKNIIYHPDYYRIPQRMGNQDFPARNNLAIIEVSVPLEFYDYVQPVQLPRRNQSLTQKEGQLTDWIDQTILQKITTPIISNEECDKFYGKYKITDEMFCTAFIDEETGNALDDRRSFSYPAALLTCSDQEVEGQVYLCGISSLQPIYNVLCDGPDEESQKLGNCDNTIQAPLVVYPTAFVDISKYVDWILDTINN